MTKPTCEVVCMTAMAMDDGWVSELSADQIEAHLAGCAECRSELRQMQALTSLLNGQERRSRTESLWENVEQHLPVAWPARISSRARYAFVILSLLLLGYRLVEMIPDRHLGLLFKLLPILFVIAAFGYLRENPFKINAELTLEGRGAK